MSDPEQASRRDNSETALESGSSDDAERFEAPAEEQARVPDSQAGPDPETAGGAEAASPEQLRAENARLRDGLEREREHALRLQAEVENIRRRAQRDLEKAHKYGTERMVGELLAVIDSMELGLSAASQEGAELQNLVEGTELTLKMLMSVLAKFEVSTVDPQGEKFDPELHQAMSMQPAQGVEPGTVVQVVQKGYQLSGRLVRPAMVIVAQ